MVKVSSLIAVCLAVLLISCGKGASNASAPQDELFISLPATDSLIVVNPDQQIETYRLKVGKLPHNIRLSADGSKIYVVLVGSQAIAEIDANSKELLRTFLTDSAPMMHDNGDPIEPHILQQADLHSSCFDCHDGKANGAKPVVVGSRPFGFALTKDNQLIVANTLSATVNYIDLVTGKITKSLSVDPSGDAREPTELAIMDNRLYLTVRPTLPSFSASVLRAYDIDSGALLSQVDVGSAVTALQIDTVNDVLYTTNFESNTLDKFDSDLQLLESYTVGNGPFGLSLDGENLLVANYYNNSISRIDLSEKNIFTQALQTDSQQFSNPTHISVSWDGENVYLISGGTKGYLLTLDRKNLAILASMKVDELPFDIINIKK